ncbi:hypothetical protein [Paenibacillus cremeus]|uniref:Uncharacterized protein n=1 Tax=Paenibacillus cremeus TaxID=2163881 RepID=A0A559KCV2_9BACL|nr:hypothetical protein [Paenibacillus cremeus]TVY09957.1 hypothetical protein FPZ49_11340 [Paenibacillus cremeus]
MELDHDIPINLIMLNNYEEERYEHVDDYIEILKTCKKADEFYALIRMIIDDTRDNTLRDILTKNIQHQAKILEETKIKKS